MRRSLEATGEARPCPGTRPVSRNVRTSPPPLGSQAPRRARCSGPAVCPRSVHGRPAGLCLCQSHQYPAPPTFPFQQQNQHFLQDKLRLVYFSLLSIFRQKNSALWSFNRCCQVLSSAPHQPSLNRSTTSADLPRLRRASQTLPSSVRPGRRRAGLQGQGSAEKPGREANSLGHQIHAVGTGLMSGGGARGFLLGQVPAVHLVPAVRGSHRSTSSQWRVTEGAHSISVSQREPLRSRPGAHAGDLSTRLRSGSHPKDLTGKPAGRWG